MPSNERRSHFTGPYRSFFVGMTFSPYIKSYQILESLRERYDSKMHFAPDLHMSLLPPFAIAPGSIDELVEEFTDTLDSYLHDLVEASYLEFKSIDLMNAKRSGLMLNLSETTDLQHCQEALAQNVLDLGGAFKIGRSLTTMPKLDGHFFKLGLPVARGIDAEQFSEIIQKVTSEVQFPLYLQIKDITLFEKLPQSWPKLKILYTFSAKSEQDLKEHFSKK